MRVNAVRAFAQKATQPIRAPPPEKERRNAPPAAPDATARRTARSHPRGRIVSAWRKRKMSPVEAAAAEERRAPRGASDERRNAHANTGPSNGAEHGVASNVANTPIINDPQYPSRGRSIPYTPRGGLIVHT